MFLVGDVSTDMLEYYCYGVIFLGAGLIFGMSILRPLLTGRTEKLVSILLGVLLVLWVLSFFSIFQTLLSRHTTTEAAKSLTSIMRHFFIVSLALSSWLARKWY